MADTFSTLQYPITPIPHKFLIRKIMLAQIYSKLKTWLLGPFRDDRLCHRSNLFMISGVRFQVSVKTNSWTLIWLQLKTNSGERKSIP